MRTTKNATARYTQAFCDGLHAHLRARGNAVIIQLTGPEPSVQYEIGGLGTAVFPIVDAASLAAWSGAVNWFRCRPGDRYTVVESPPGEFRIEQNHNSHAELVGGEL